MSRRKAPELDHEHFMRQALNLAKISFGEGELPVGVVIVRDNGVIATGTKAADAHRRLDHAEMVGLRAVLKHKTQKWLGDMTVYTTLEPCTMCFGTLLNCRIGGIVYALEDVYGGATCIPKEACPPRHQDEFPFIVPGVLREESRALFRKFFETTDQEFWQKKDNPLVKLCFA